MSEALIIIPARMGSTRFPGKPLAEIAGVSMLRRTANVAAQLDGADYVVATDHADIVAHCERHNLPVVLTKSDLPSGSDRCLAAATAFGFQGDILVNLQGDAPFTAPSHIRLVIDALAHGSADIATPYIQMDWPALDNLRKAKEETPFSGTTVIVDAKGHAVWFSKNIIPALRKEALLRDQSPLSPICRHIGLYAYRRAALERFTRLPESPFETLEGLEQLRALEDGMVIEAVAVTAPELSPGLAMSGIDTPEDLARAEALIARHGDPYKPSPS